MNSLLDELIDAHGGAARWKAVTAVQAGLVASGWFWARKGWPEPAVTTTVRADAHRQHLTMAPFGTAGTLELTVDPEGREHERLRLDDEVRIAPRAWYAGLGVADPWDDPLRTGYFLGYAMWNYLTTPFLLAEPQVTTTEIEPWHDDPSGETWRRLRAEFGPRIATHTRAQDFFVGPDGLLRRLDYSVDVNGDASVAHLVSGYRTVDGIVVPTHREVRRRLPDGSPDHDAPAAIVLDLDDLRIEGS